MVKEHSRFQLEAAKLGRKVVFQVTVFERTDKTRTRLYAETQCSDPMHFLLQFIVRDATDFENLLQKFISELDFRGFVAERYRLREARRWGPWTEAPQPVPGAAFEPAPDRTAGAAKA
jgi:hypothetical protein